MNRSEKRTSRAGVQIGLWVAAAAGALLLGMTAVGSIGSDLGGGGEAQPLAAEEIEARLAGQAAADPAPGPAAPQAPPPAQAPAHGPVPPTVVPAGAAGTVLVRCDGATPAVVSVNPAQGFERDDDVGAGQVGFDGDDVDVRVALSCAGGTPTGQVSTVGEDDDD